jgi:hypothetical protein
MRKKIGAVVMLGALGALTACAGSKATGFGNRNAPNEFAVTRSPPLVIPPDYALRPPKPGAPRPQEATAATQALSAMFGGPVKTSAGQQALIDAAGGTPDAGIRSAAGSPGTDVVDKGAATTKAILAAPAGNTQNTTATTPQ